MNNAILQTLAALQTKPALFTPGEPLFWTDPHIARQMLAAHLDPEIEAASRRPKTIERASDWIANTLGLQSGDRVLDLGCGPGLYAIRLARRGFHVTGVDFSLNSIEYARQNARENDLQIEYRCQDYLELDDLALYDAVLLIYGDYCPLSPSQRVRLLKNVSRALKPGGHFVLDVSTPTLRAKYGLQNGWYSAPDGGFWKPGEHLVLEQGFSYPDESIYLDQYIVIEPGEKISVYRNWFQDFTPDHIRAELEAGGFVIEGLWNDLEGSPLTADGEWIGVVSRYLGNPAQRNPT